MSVRTLRKAGGLVLAVLLCTAATRLAADEPAVVPEPLARLRAGNARFVANPQNALPIDAWQRSDAAKSQAPFATVLTCADSRVPPEVIFQTGLGDLFVVRVAGNVPDRAVLASIEYGAEHLHVPLVVVMGHEFCGAVKATIETPAAKSLGPNLDFLLGAIRPSAIRTAPAPEATRLRAAILANVEQTVNDLMKNSAILRELSQQDKIAFVGAYYELTTGRVHFSEPVRRTPGNH